MPCGQLTLPPFSRLASLIKALHQDLSAALPALLEFANPFFPSMPNSFKFLPKLDLPGPGPAMGWRSLVLNLSQQHPLSCGCCARGAPCFTSFSVAGACSPIKASSRYLPLHPTSLHLPAQGTQNPGAARSHPPGGRASLLRDTRCFGTGAQVPSWKRTKYRGLDLIPLLQPP